MGRQDDISAIRGDNGLPQDLAIFPLRGVLLLPGGQLSLHIFEERYKAMVDDVLAGSRMIGMIQLRDDQGEIYPIGCAGRIQSYEQTQDGRYFLVLEGVSRFHVMAELPPERGYRRARADWSSFGHDRQRAECLDLDRDRLNILLGDYFAIQDMDCDWDAVMQASDQRLITCLSMICPFDPSEKQALLEAPDCRRRAEIFMAMLELAVKQCGATACH